MLKPALGQHPGDPVRVGDVPVDRGVVPLLSAFAVSDRHQESKGAGASADEFVQFGGELFAADRLVCHDEVAGHEIAPRVAFHRQSSSRGSVAIDSKSRSIGCRLSRPIPLADARSLEFRRHHWPVRAKGQLRGAGRPVTCVSSSE